MPVLGLDLDPQTAGGAGGVVDLQSPPLESDRPGHHLSPPIGRMQGGESIQAQGQPLQVGGGLAVIPLQVERHLRRTGPHHPQGRVVGSGGPVALTGSGPDEALLEGEFVAGRPRPRREHHGVGDIPHAPADAVVAQIEEFQLAWHQQAPAEMDAARKGDVDLGGTEIGLGLVGVEVLGGRGGARVAVAHVRLRTPVEKITGGGPSRCPAPSHHVAGVEHVLLFHLRPEHDVLRIEVVLHGIGDDGGFPNLSPANAVFRNVAHQAVRCLDIPRVGLVAFRPGHPGTSVQEGAELARNGHDDVVGGGAVNFDQPQVGLGPVDPVPALGIAGQSGPGETATVVHPVDIAILEDGGVEGQLILPGLVILDCDVFRSGLLELQLQTFQPVHQIAVHKELTLRAQRQRLGNTIYRQDQNQDYRCRHQTAQAVGSHWISSLEPASTAGIGFLPVR